MYAIIFTKRAVNDTCKLKESKLDGKAKKIIALLKENPFQTPPSYEKLTGDLRNMFSRRINIKHRLVYSVYPDELIVKIISMWSHYE